MICSHRARARGVLRLRLTASKLPWLNWVQNRSPGALQAPPEGICAEQAGEMSRIWAAPSRSGLGSSPRAARERRGALGLAAATSPSASRPRFRRQPTPFLRVLLPSHLHRGCSLGSAGRNRPCPPVPCNRRAGRRVRRRRLPR